MTVSPLAIQTSGTAFEAALDSLAHLTAEVCEVPLALIIFFGAEHQSSRSNSDLLSAQSFRESALYSYAVLQPAAFVISNIVHDDRFINSGLFVSDSPIQFCAGAPLLMPDGSRVGVLCVLDFVARELSERQKSLLTVLAQQAATHFAARTNEAVKHRHIENSLRENEAKYRSLVESLPAIVYLAEPNPPYAPIYVSPSIEELGYSLAEWFKRPNLWVSMLHPADSERVLADTAAAMTAGRENDYEYRVVARDGKERWVHDRGRFVLDKDNQPLCWQGIIIDITERKQTEAKLADLHRQLEENNDDLLSILDQLRLGVVMLDSNGCVTFLSEACQKVLGSNFAESVGKSWQKICPIEEADKIQIQKTIDLPPEKRTRILVHIKTETAGLRCIEIDVQDDPRDSLRKNLFLYDVSDVHDLRRQLDEKAQFRDLIGKSDPMRLVYQQVQEVAQLDASVLIQGETGTGKELVARAIHFSSSRRHKPFIAVNCASLDESLLTSQLFGHKRGAFTGAITDHVGIFEAANDGTLLLDEIGDMPLPLQAALLRVLQEKEVTRLGETKPRKINVRVLAATQHDLLEEIAKGNFRADLLYRIRVVRICLPPLRTRREDIPLLVGSFLAQHRAATGKSVTGISDDAMRTLLDCAWAGNVRELKSAVEVAAIFCKGQIIQSADLPNDLLDLSNRKTVVVQEKPLDEKALMLDALKSVNGNRAAAARVLGIGRATLYRRLTNLGIEKQR